LPDIEERNEYIMGQYLSYLLTTRKHMTQLGEKYCATFSMNLVYPWNDIKMCLNKTYSTECIDKPLSDAFPIQNNMKQDALLPLLFNFALENAIRKDWN